MSRPYSDMSRRDAALTPWRPSFSKTKNAERIPSPNYNTKTQKSFTRFHVVRKWNEKWDAFQTRSTKHSDLIITLHDMKAGLKIMKILFLEACRACGCYWISLRSAQCSLLTRQRKAEWLNWTNLMFSPYLN